MFNIDSFKTLCKAREQSILSVMSSFLKTKYSNVEHTPAYVFAAGDIPVALVAHADTVFKGLPKYFFYDSKQTVLWSPEGMGADDRAGIYAIMEIIKRTQLRPHVIITTGEEVGCIGASKLIGHYPKFPYELKYLIQLDRRGSKDCVFYDCDNKQFEKFIESFGFETNWGSLSDISVLAPAWGIAAANLSVGYYNEHTETEFLCFNFLHSTIEKVKQMLAYTQEHKEMPTWKYVPSVRWFSGNRCERCGIIVPAEEIIPVRYDDCVQHVCIDCFEKMSHKISYCDRCGMPGMADTYSVSWICPECRKELDNGNTGSI